MNIFFVSYHYGVDKLIRILKQECQILKVQVNEF